MSAPPDNPPKQRFARLRAFRGWVRGLPGGRLVWRLVVTLLGAAVIAIGIVLLPLPGPGWVIIFAGLGILASEYAWARRLLSFLRRQAKKWSQWLARQPLWVRLLGGLISLAFLAAVVIAAWYIAHDVNL
jgi:uncharacterized protein (TIGR02611 family)